MYMYQRKSMECMNIEVDPKRQTPSPSRLEEQGSEKKKKIVIRYKECQKNHAAAIGGNARDGCGEFMPSGEEGSPESLTCSACNCHRNFHRKHFESQDFNSDDHFIIKPVSSVHNDDDEKDERVMKKRVRTKFSEEQKEKMVRFAEKVGWRIQKVEESVVQQFCQEVGIKRRVLKVWMHNNKNTFAKRIIASSPTSTS